MNAARTAAGLSFVLLGALLAIPVGAQAGLAESCPWGTAVPSRVNLIRTQRATRCLINRIRVDAGLRPLRFNRALGRAAVLHARDQARRRYCAHSSPDGRQPVHRALALGYGSSRRLPVVAEDVACGPQLQVSPGRVVEEWLDSDDHRATLLDGRFVDAGVGIAVSGGLVIITVDLGYRP